MSTEAKEPAANAAPAGPEGLSLVLPPYMAENFETARRQIQEFYGLSPDIPSLMRLWLACGTSWRIRKEFEHAVLDIRRRTLNPNSDGVFDEDCL